MVLLNQGETDVYCLVVIFIQPMCISSLKGTLQCGHVTSPRSPARCNVTEPIAVRAKRKRVETLPR